MITPLPNPPLVTDSPTDFQNKASAFLAALPTFALQANSDIAGITNTAATPMWTATTTYSQGNVVWSPATFQNYRLRVATLTGAAGNADPSVDTANWTQVSGTGNVSNGGPASFTNVTATGNLSVQGNVSLGDAGTDTTTVASQLSANASVGTSGQVLTSRGANLSPQWTTPATITQGAAVTASGTAIDFLGIPSGVKRITVMFMAVSTNGASENIIQLGTAGGFVTTNYFSNATRPSSTFTHVLFTTGFGVTAAAAATRVISGKIEICNLSGNTWVSSGVLADRDSGTERLTISGGYVALGASLDRIRVTTNGADAFDAGSINIFYE